MALFSNNENPEINLNLTKENGIFSGRVQNCYVRLDTSPETPPGAAPGNAVVLEIFFPKSADEDRWGIRDILNIQHIVNKEWIDASQFDKITDLAKRYVEAVNI